MLRIDALTRAVVTPPHLPAKMNDFYALMRRALGPAWHGPRGNRRVDSSMHFYAPCLCRLAIGELLVPQYFGSKVFFDHYTYEKESLL